MASFSSGSDQEDEVLAEEKSFVRTLILNRPKQLNAASRYMISRLLELFLVYEKDSNVKLVILKGKGRAFCAGGDVAALVHDINNGNWKSCAIVSWNVFTLNYLMATYSKPQVFAMPETALGFFPDTGASYLLSRLPGHFGEYLGLTGARVDGAEMLACGLATHFVPSVILPSLEAALHTADSSDKAIISAVIDQYSELPKLKEQSRMSSIGASHEEQWKTFYLLLSEKP